jgi:hypothetical protein
MTSVAKIERQMSMTTADILQKMISEGCHIAVLRGPTPEYKDHISVCRGDGIAIGTLSCETFKSLLEADFVKQVGRGDESDLTIFKLSDRGRMSARSVLKTGFSARKMSEGKTYQPWLSVAGTPGGQEHRLA